MTSHVVIIGGTGMLSAAARHIVRDNVVTLLSRTPQTIAQDIGATAIPMDWWDTQSVQQAVDTLLRMPPANVLISWIHDARLSCLPLFEKTLTQSGRSIRIHGSAAGDPAMGIHADPAASPHIVRQDIVLGWMRGRAGKRWLTHQEISDGLLHVYHHPQITGHLVGQLS